MTADSKGNNLQAVDIPITGQLAIAPYDAANLLTSEQGGGKTVTWPSPNPYEWLGLIKQDGGATESQDKGDAIEFFQKGYYLNPDPTLTIQYGLAEFNAAVRKLITGQTADANGMIAVDTYTPDTKWILFYEEINKNGKIRRLTGVVQVTKTEVDQSERGSVKGRSVTMTWQPDEHVGNGSTTKFNEWQYDSKRVKSVAVTASDGGSTPKVQVKQSVQLKAVATLADESTSDVTASAQWSSDADSKATIDKAGKVTGVSTGAAHMVASIDGVQSKPIEVTVTA
ncbi:MAG: Ig-like domain-containing protein [Bifidobacterium crudilactis]|nr:Ig-like domain-containing protein [Bifidobacterium crudilactis]